MQYVHDCAIIHTYWKIILIFLFFSHTLRYFNTHFKKVSILFQAELLLYGGLIFNRNSFIGYPDGRERTNNELFQ